MLKDTPEFSFTTDFSSINVTPLLNPELIALARYSKKFPTPIREYKGQDVTFTWKEPVIATSVRNRFGALRKIPDFSFLQAVYDPNSDFAALEQVAMGLYSTKDALRINREMPNIQLTENERESGLGLAYMLRLTRLADLVEQIPSEKPTVAKQMLEILDRMKLLNPPAMDYATMDTLVFRLVYQVEKSFSESV